jgi:monovalent cation:H+ antiporter-2, CPA2 family
MFNVKPGIGAVMQVIERANWSDHPVLWKGELQGFQTERILELARALNPGIDTAVRTHSEAETTHLTRLGVGVAIMGERELALSLMDYALQSLGANANTARVTVQGVRLSWADGADEHPPETPARTTPELRPRRDDSPPVD